MLRQLSSVSTQTSHPVDTEKVCSCKSPCGIGGYSDQLVDMSIRTGHLCVIFCHTIFPGMAMEVVFPILKQK